MSAKRMGILKVAFRYANGEIGLREASMLLNGEETVMALREQVDELTIENDVLTKIQEARVYELERTKSDLERLALRARDLQRDYVQATSELERANAKVIVLETKVKSFEEHLKAMESEE